MTKIPLHRVLTAIDQHGAQIQRWTIEGFAPVRAAHPSGQEQSTVQAAHRSGQEQSAVQAAHRSGQEQSAVRAAHRSGQEPSTVQAAHFSGQEQPTVQAAHRSGPPCVRIVVASPIYRGNPNANPL
ncbi:hypothetical protein [Methylophaga sp.]|uniref:hypothetical protein n=1 Tax=Methylophaga sp. TaxID=2024840 RepID=UPI0027283BF7|nr:hypothetical protein [Methylophaga sp.]MDO8825233.1 hypothetical protein [Methylophaga sp.]